MQTVIHGTERVATRSMDRQSRPLGTTGSRGWTHYLTPRNCVAPADNVMIRLRPVMSYRASTVKRPGTARVPEGAQLTNGAGGKCLPIAALVGSGQLVLFGELRRLRIPADLWRSWLTDRGQQRDDHRVVTPAHRRATITATK